MKFNKELVRQEMTQVIWVSSANINRINVVTDYFNMSVMEKNIIEG